MLLGQYYVVDKTGLNYVGKIKQTGSLAQNGVKYATAGGGSSVNTCGGNTHADNGSDGTCTNAAKCCGTTDSTAADLYTVTRSNSFGGDSVPRYFYVLVYINDMNGGSSDWMITWKYTGQTITSIPFEYLNSDQVAITNTQAFTSTSAMVVYNNEDAMSSQSTSTLVSAKLASDATTDLWDAAYTKVIAGGGPGVNMHGTCVTDTTAPVQSNTHPASYTLYTATSSAVMNFHTPSNR